ncbi:MAG: YcxB family protein [Bacilli bacterium]
MDKVVTKTKYSRKEHKKFYMFHLFHKSTTLYWMMFFLLMILVLVVVNIFQAVESGDFSNVWMTLIMFSIAAAIIPFLMITKINQVIKKETPERLKSTDTIEVTKHKIQRSCDNMNGKAVIGWGEVELVCENDNYFYLYGSENTGIFLKKADIIEGDLDMMRKMINNNVTRDKKGKPNYKRFGKIKKEYDAIQKTKKAEDKKAKKAQKALEKSQQEKK